jgi:hypothetical protein
MSFAPSSSGQGSLVESSARADLPMESGPAPASERDR